MAANSTQKHPVSLWLLKGLMLGLGLSALPPGVSMILDPSGQGLGFPSGALEHSPFRNYTIPGYLLMVFIGLLPLVAWYGLWRRPRWSTLQRMLPFQKQHWSWTLSLASGIGLMIWILVQITMVPYFFLQPLMFIWGASVVTLCVLPGIRNYYKN